MRVGIVGHGQDKFSLHAEYSARMIIVGLVRYADVVISGHSPVGGIDIWAEEEAELQGVPTAIKTPEIHQWNPNGYGYKARNLDIARESDVVHVLVVDSYPPEYEGRRFPLCYHCQTTEHIKSGGCWTGHQAIKAGNRAQWWTIRQSP